MMDTEVIKGIKFVDGINEMAARIVVSLRWADERNVESPSASLVLYHHPPAEARWKAGPEPALEVLVDERIETAREGGKWA
jgi:hypothetical protein